MRVLVNSKPSNCVNMIEFRKIKGIKNKYGSDEVLLIKTTGWHALKNQEMLKIIKEIFENESRIYPKEEGFMGCDMFFNEIQKLKNET